MGISVPYRYPLRSLTSYLLRRLACVQMSPYYPTSSPFARRGSASTKDPHRESPTQTSPTIRSPDVRNGSISTARSIRETPSSLGLFLPSSPPSSAIESQIVPQLTSSPPTLGRALMHSSPTSPSSSAGAPQRSTTRNSGDNALLYNPNDSTSGHARSFSDDILGALQGSQMLTTGDSSEREPSIGSTISSSLPSSIDSVHRHTRSSSNSDVGCSLMDFNDPKTSVYVFYNTDGTVKSCVVYRYLTNYRGLSHCFVVLRWRVSLTSF